MCEDMEIDDKMADITDNKPTKVDDCVIEMTDPDKQYEGPEMFIKQRKKEQMKWLDC